MVDENSDKTQDISNKTIVVLVILTVIISILGTLTVLSETSNIKAVGQPTIMSKSSSSSGRVSLTIKEPEGPVHSAGYVTLEVK